MKKKTKLEKLDVPRLDDEIKKLNGKSSKNLRSCIDNLKKSIDEDKDTCTADYSDPE